MVNELPDSVKVKRYTKAFAHLRFSDIMQAKMATDSSYKYAVRSKMEKLIGRSIVNQGSYFYMQNELDTALTMYYRAYEYYLTCGDLRESAGVLINIANCLGEKGDVISAQRAHHRSLQIQDSLGIGGMAKGINLLNLGVLYSDIESRNEGNKYYRSARNIFQGLDDEVGIAEIDFNIAINLYDLDSVPAAQKILDRLEVYHRKENHIYFLINVLMESGKNSFVKGEYDKSEKMLLEALTLAKDNNDESNYGYLYNKLMALNIKTGNMVAAEKYGLLSCNYTLEKGNLLELVKDYNSLSQLYYDNKNFEKAYQYHVKFHNLQDSLLSVEKSKSIADLKTKYETEKKDAEINALNQEIAISNLRKSIYGICFLASLIALLLGYFWFRQRAKNERIKRDAKENELKKEIEFKKKELTSQTLHLVRKNTFIQNLSQELQGANITEDDYKKEIRKVLTSLKLEPELDKDWQLFKSYFTDVHNDFDHRIKSHCPTINENEMRLAYLMRMQLNASEISAVMRVLPESVRKSKYRLKKKLGLEKQQDLNQFLVSV